MKPMRQFAIGSALRIPLLLWTIAVIFPIVWVLLSALKSNAEIFASPWGLPQVFNFANFAKAWSSYHIGQSFVNSIVVTAVGTVLNLAMAIPSAYAIERVPFRGSALLHNVYLSAMMIPMVLGWIPLFFLLMKFQMLNNLFGLAVVYAVSRVPFSIFILASFIGSIPKELEESATMDGLSPYGVLLRIVTPLAMTGIVTVTIMNGIQFWNEYFMALIFMQDQAKYTLGVAMDFLNKKAQYENAWGVLFAGLSVSMIPVMLVYGFFQRHIVRGMIEGAVKG
ncbi:sugar ABC transporter permease [Gordoniibacillus kamchatkensis]|uniref:Sugar ABC transporter permease n=1 Tax=Gordoniibacillus kamchatkensis TaxID=1590651 RepID=A0ABR5ABS5_9BACL|nr:carbohydrate ABC transporter permease [Paenibacillus sp. VKM B-2647]KIL37827.1 sugar ABC transporter permease [Paenibacillus sp. VKM B-2647]